MTWDLTERIQLTFEDRDVIVKYGYVSGRLEARHPLVPAEGQAIHRVGMTWEKLHLLIGDLSHSIVCFVRRA